MPAAAVTNGVAVPPGSPEELRAGARTLLAAADALDGVVIELQSVGSAVGGRRWTGPASNAFQINVDETGASVANGARRFRDAAAALTTLAGELEAVREQARHARVAAAVASTLFSAATEDLAGLAEGDADALARARLEDQRDTARMDLMAAHAAGAEAAEHALVAGRVAAGALQAATDAVVAPPPPPGSSAASGTTGQQVDLLARAQPSSGGGGGRLGVVGKLLAGVGGGVVRFVESATPLGQANVAFNNPLAGVVTHRVPLVRDLAIWVAEQQASARYDRAAEAVGADPASGWYRGGEAAATVLVAAVTAGVGGVGSAGARAAASRTAASRAAGPADTLDLPASTTWGRLDTLEDHFLRHGADLGATSAHDYATRASQFFQRSQWQRFPTTVDADGIIRVYDPATNTFGAFNPNGTTRTFFTPKRGTDYWADQPGAAPWGP
jgi:uncharacterized protein YukE